MRNHTLISPKIAPHILTLAIILAQPYFACKIMYTENKPKIFTSLPLFFMLFRWVGTPVTLSNSPIFLPETQPPPHAFSLHEKTPSPEENREGVFSMFFVYSIY